MKILKMYCDVSDGKRFQDLRQELDSPTSAAECGSVRVRDDTDDDAVQFESFMYWRPVLPDIDLDLLEMCSKITEVKINENEKKFDLPKEKEKEEKLVEESAFSNFNFWRMPMMPIKIELDV